METSRNIRRRSAITGLSAAKRLLRQAFGPALIGALALLAPGCASLMPREVMPEASAATVELDGFHNIRFWGDASTHDIAAILMADPLNADRHSAASPAMRRPIANLLAISGGAEDGAFGAGLLVGWSETGTRPSFDVVTGVSSGALIAPFAFV